MFAEDRLGFAYNTEALEKLLKEYFGTKMAMNDVQYPRYMVECKLAKYYLKNCTVFSTKPVHSFNVVHI